MPSAYGYVGFMPIPQDDPSIDQLEGGWRIGATNMAEWLPPMRGDGRVEFSVAPGKGTRVTEVSTFTTPDEKTHRESRIAVWQGDGYVTRASGFALLRRLEWLVAGYSDDGSLLVIRYPGPHGVTARVLVLLRDSAEVGDLRSRVAKTSGDLGLSMEEYASLTWLV